MKAKAGIPVLVALGAIASVAPLQGSRLHSKRPVDSASVAGYRSWKQITSKPHRVLSRLSALCSSVATQQAAGTTNPHEDKWVKVYVNEAAQRAMLRQKKPAFPQGSLIVKEKMAAPDSRAPELLTVMRKRQKGYNPVGGDWEYLVYDGTGTKVQSRGRLQNCQSCHAQWKASDYVSRVYFTAAMTRRFR